MSVGLLGLLDDVTALAKVAAASIDDVAGQAAKAGLQGRRRRHRRYRRHAQLCHRLFRRSRAAHRLEDRRRLDPQQAADPVAGRAGAQLLRPLAHHPALDDRRRSTSATRAPRRSTRPSSRTPPTSSRPSSTSRADNPRSLEEARVAGAIQTDFILSAEIMTIALAALPDLPFWEQALVLVVVAFGITALVYGAVALIVKADDIGLALARSGRTGAGRALGRGMLVAMPWVMQTLSIVGTAAMIWVGGGIVVHGLAGFGLSQVEHVVEAFAHGAEELRPGHCRFRRRARHHSRRPGDRPRPRLRCSSRSPTNVIGPLWHAIRGLLPKRA